jgi:hypothetical protein
MRVVSAGSAKIAAAVAGNTKSNCPAHHRGSAFFKKTGVFWQALATQQDGFAAEQVDGPQGVLGLRDERQP